jgi:hypothetical protein
MSIDSLAHADSAELLAMFEAAASLAWEETKEQEHTQAELLAMFEEAASRSEA